MIARRSLVLATLAVALPGALAAQATKGKATKPATPAAAAAPAAAPATDAQLPSARQVIDAYVQAIGGRDVIASRKSSRATMTLEMPAAGMKADIEASTMAPNKVFVKTTMPGLGEMMQGYDGTTAWAIDPMQGARVLSGKELDQMKVQADHLAELRDAAQFTTMDVVEKTTFEGRPAYKVRLVRLTGEEVREFYDVETKLLLGSQSTVETQMGPIEATTIRQEYKSMNGMLVPTKQVQRANGQELVITLVSTEIDKVDPAVFELPAQIKALVPAK